MLASLQGHPELTAHEIIREYWKRRLGDKDFEKRWQKALHDGLVSDTRAKPREVTWSFADRMPDVHSADTGIELHSKSPSVRIPRSGTAGLPTTAGSKNCPSL